MSIEQTITDAIAEAIQPDKIKAIIEPQIEKMLADALGQLFRYRGPASLAVEAAIKDQMHIDPARLNFTSYNAMMLAVMKNYMEVKANAAIAKLSEEELGRIFRDPPAEITVTELIEQWMGQHDADPEQDDRDPFYEFSRRSDQLTGESFSLKLKRPDFSHDTIEIHCNREKILSVTVKEWDGKTIKTPSPSLEFSLGRYNLERDICKMYAAGTRVIDDE
ncbi:MAG: hypothetical protein ABID63_18445 [Pseudomonadota bacterium]